MNDDKLKAIGKLLNAVDNNEQAHKSEMSRRWFIRTLGGMASLVVLGLANRAEGMTCDGCYGRALNPCTMNFVCDAGFACASSNTCSSGNSCSADFTCTSGNECVVNNTCSTSNKCSKDDSCHNGNICTSGNSCVASAHTCTRNDSPQSCKMFS
jgi:hypothetical protein